MLPSERRQFVNVRVCVWHTHTCCNRQPLFVHTHTHDMCTEYAPNLAPTLCPRFDVVRDHRQHMSHLERFINLSTCMWKRTCGGARIREWASASLNSVMRKPHGSSGHLQTHTCDLLVGTNGYRFSASITHTLSARTPTPNKPFVFVSTLLSI